MATDEERDGARTKITLAAHGGLIKVEIAPGLGGRVVLSADDGEVALGLLIGVEEQEVVIDAIRRAQGRHAPASTPLEERIAKAIQASIRERDAAETEREEAVHIDGYAKGLRAALAMVREAGPTVPRGAVEALRARLLAVDSGTEDIILDAFATILDATPTEPR